MAIDSVGPASLALSVPPSVCNQNFRRTFLRSEKSSGSLGKEKLSRYWCEKARKHMCVTDRHDMTLAFKVGLSPNTTNQPFLSNHASQPLQTWYGASARGPTCCLQN